MIVLIRSLLSSTYSKRLCSRANQNLNSFSEHQHEHPSSMLSIALSLHISSTKHRLVTLLTPLESSENGLSNSTANSKLEFSRSGAFSLRF